MPTSSSFKTRAQRWIIHLRNKTKPDGTFDHKAEILQVERIPNEICKELLDADLQGKQFVNPYSIPAKYKEKEGYIRQLIRTKNETEAELSRLKSEILQDMEAIGARTWETETMRLTMKMPSVRVSFNAAKFKEDHPEIDFTPYERTSNVSGSLLIAV